MWGIELGLGAQKWIGQGSEPQEDYNLIWQIIKLSFSVINVNLGASIDCFMPFLISWTLEWSRAQCVKWVPYCPIKSLLIGSFGSICPLHVWGANTTGRRLPCPCLLRAHGLVGGNTHLICLPSNLSWHGGDIYRVYVYSPMPWLLHYLWNRHLSWKIQLGPFLAHFYLCFFSLNISSVRQPELTTHTQTSSTKAFAVRIIPVCIYSDGFVDVGFISSGR